MHRGQTAAKFESIISNAGDAVRECHRGQPAATPESRTSNAGDAIRNRHRRQTAAITESITSNAGDATRNGVSALFSTWGCHKCSFVFIEQHTFFRAIIRIIRSDINSGQPAATRESIASNAGDATRNRHRGQTAAIPESIISYAGDIIWNY